MRLGQFFCQLTRAATSKTSKNQLKFDFKKHFNQNPKVNVYTMEALGHPGDSR